MSKCAAGLPRDECVPARVRLGKGGMKGAALCDDWREYVDCFVCRLTWICGLLCVSIHMDM
eukprot:1151924-Pelagomonas_calceolata.AAC.3